MCVYRIACSHNATDCVALDLCNGIGPGRVGKAVTAMKPAVKHTIMTAITVVALGLAIHSGQTQGYYNVGGQVPGLGPTVIGPGVAPNVNTRPDPSALSYYGSYYDEGPWGSYANANRRGNVYNVTFGPSDIPRTSDKISVRRTGTASLNFKWEGEPQAVSNIVFSLLDKNSQTVVKQQIRKLPATATLKKTTSTTSYSVAVTYINGTTNTIVAPL